MQKKLKDQLESVSGPLLPYFQEGVRIVIWFFLIATLVIFTLHSVLSIQHPYSMDYGEAPLIDQAIRLSHGENIYRAQITKPPYTIANYPPLYVVSLIPFLDLFDSPFQMGRVISVVSALFSAAFIGLTIYTTTKDRLSALVAGLFLLANPYVIGWSGLARIDSLALAFATGALFVLARNPQSRRAWFVSGLLLIAAAYTRQSYALAAPLAAFVWLWVHNRRRALELALLVAGVGAVLFIVLNLITQGGFFFNIVTANVNEFRWEQLEDQLNRFWEDGWIILLMAAAFLALGWRSVKSWFLVAPFLVGGALTALTIGKIGSNINYFLEIAAALAIVAGMMMAWARNHPWRLILITGLITFQFGLYLESAMQNNVDFNLATRLNDTANLQLIEREMKLMPGVVLADEDMGLLTMNGRPLYLQPFEVSQLANAGIWDERPLLLQIAAQDFDGIFIHHFGPWPVHKQRWTPAMLKMIDTYYRPVKTLAGTVIYIPQEESGISAVPTPVQSSTQAPPPPGMGN